MCSCVHSSFVRGLEIRLINNTRWFYLSMEKHTCLILYKKLCQILGYLLLSITMDNFIQQRESVTLGIKWVLNCDSLVWAGHMSWASWDESCQGCWEFVRAILSANRSTMGRAAKREGAFCPGSQLKKGAFCPGFPLTKSLRVSWYKLLNWEYTFSLPDNMQCNIR
jgi:hypothetical protein